MKEEIIKRLEQLAKEDMTDETFAMAEEIKNEYLQACETLSREQLEKFISEGGQEQEFLPAKDPLDDSFNSHLATLNESAEKLKKKKKSVKKDKAETVPGNKAEIIHRLEELIKEDMTDETFAKAEEIKNEYLRACETLSREQLEKFISEGGQEQEFLPAKDPLDDSFNSHLATLNESAEKLKKKKKSVKKDKAETVPGNKAEIIHRLEELIKEEMTDETFAKADEIKNEYLRACETLSREQLERFISEGGQEQEFLPAKDPLDDSFNSHLATLNESAEKLKKKKKPVKKDKAETIPGNKAEIIHRLEELIKEEMTDETFAKAEEIKNEYLHACETLSREQLEKFISEGGQEQEFLPAKDPLDDSFNSHLATLNESAEKLKKRKRSVKKDKAETVPGNKAEIINRLEELIKEEMTDETFAKAEEIKNEYLRACELVSHEELEKFLAEGGNADDFQPAKDPLDISFSDYIRILSDRESKFKRLKKNEVQDKMKAKEEIINELQKLISEETNIGKAFNAFKELQAKWNDLGNIPNREYKNIQSIYHRHTHNFYYNMKLSKDLKELDFKRNLEFRTQLLAKIESLLQIESIRGMERMIKLYRMEWSEMGPTAPEKTDELRSRYRELIGEVYQKVRAFYKERQKEEHTNLAAKKVLLERAQKISEEKFDTPKQWQTMTDTLQKILLEWKQIGFAPKVENEKLWENFRTALKVFYTNKRFYFGELKKLYKGNREKKTAILSKAEEFASATHEDWDASTKKVLQLQKDWKESGHIDAWDENKLWKKFREACDKFFEAKRASFGERDAGQAKNLEKKEDIISRLEAFKPTGKAEDDLKTLREISAEWKTIDHVPYKDKQRIYEKYKKVLDAKYDSLKIEGSQMNLIKFRNNVELLAQSEDSGNLMRKERSTIQDKIKRLQATINQYENNLGFFSSSKNMGGLLKEVEDNLSKAKEELQMLQKKLKMFSDVAK